MQRRLQLIDKNGEVVADKTVTFNDALTDEGYRFPAHKSGARMFDAVQFPGAMTDADIGKMTRLSKLMIADTNALGYRSGRNIKPYTANEICSLVGLSGKRGKQFIQRMEQLKIMKKKQMQGSDVFYIINPAYFMAAGKRLTCSLFLEFQNELSPLLPGYVVAWFVTQARTKQGD